MSRRPRSELQFGSDSFLDVVANIVGILIILIVIAGLRVSQAPVRVARPESVPSAAVEPPLTPFPEPENEPPSLEIVEEISTEPAPLHQVKTVPSLEPVPLEPPPTLVRRADDLKAEIDQLTRDYRAAADETAAARQTETEWNERLARVRSQVQTREQQAGELADDLEIQRTSIRQLKSTAETLLRQIDEEERKNPPVEALEHRVTPLSRVIHSHEQHYRLSANRVSEVPITLLSARLRDQIERRKDWLVKQQSQQGTVGPIQGYTMNYLVRRESMGVIDEVRYGSGMVKITVANWRIEPEAELITESATEALKPGARFYESLVNADEKTSLTFWVYPDSYPIYRKLQKFAHQQGFLVAGRPLPEGIAISGSPNGSKSAGQ